MTGRGFIGRVFFAKRSTEGLAGRGFLGLVFLAKHCTDEMGVTGFFSARKREVRNAGGMGLFLTCEAWGMGRLNGRGRFFAFFFT